MVDVRNRRTTCTIFRPLLVVGARPNLIKMAPIYHQLNAKPDCNPLVLHTGQHYDHAMSGSFFKDLELPGPDHRFDIQNRDRAGLLDEVERKTINIIKREGPDCVIVFGDVNSTLAAARAAKHEDVPLIHVEAGLRSGDLSMPEELNRIEVDKLSDLLFATEQSALDHLLEEGIPSARCHFVGNVMIDTLLKYKSRAERKYEKGYILWTAHRPVNVDSEAGILNLLTLLELACKHHRVVWPVHPRTKMMLEDFNVWSRLSQLDNLKLLPPQNYLSFLSWMIFADAVVTDSGGVQEECCALKVPCVTMRDNTERPVTLENGANRLVQALEPEEFKDSLSEALDSSRKWPMPALWDGDAAKRIVDIILMKYQKSSVSRLNKIELDQPKVIT